MIAINLLAPDRLMAKLACSSLQRVLTAADLHCWKNDMQQLFRIERAVFFEHVVEHFQLIVNPNSLNCLMKNPDFSDNVTNVFTDSAMIAMRNPDHLWPESFGGKPDLQYSEDRKERIRNSAFAALLTDEELDVHSHRFVSSPGIFSVRGVKLERLAEVWKQAQEIGKDLDESIREKAVWNKTLVMLAGEMTQKPFERGEVIPVREGEIDWDEVRNACIVSVSDWKDEKAKEHFLRCLYFGHFFGDETGLMLNILDP